MWIFNGQQSNSDQSDNLIVNQCVHQNERWTVIFLLKILDSIRRTHTSSQKNLENTYPTTWADTTVFHHTHDYMDRRGHSPRQYRALHAERASPQS